MSARHPIQTGYLMTRLWERSRGLARGKAERPDAGRSAADRQKLQDALRALGYVK